MHHSRHIAFVAFWGTTNGFLRAPSLNSNSSEKAASRENCGRTERLEAIVGLRVLIHFKAKSLVRSATLLTLRCLTQSGITEWRRPVALVGTLSCFHTSSIPNGSQGLASRAATPKYSCDSNNIHRRCYARVTHDPRCRARKRLLERNLNEFLALVGRSSRLSWLGPHNNGISENARKTLTPVTRKTPKTPACVTHRLRTPGFMLYIRTKVNGQTPKAGVMQMLCTLLCTVWNFQNSRLTSWQRSG